MFGKSQGLGSARTASVEWTERQGEPRSLFPRAVCGCLSLLGTSHGRGLEAWLAVTEPDNPVWDESWPTISLSFPLEMIVSHWPEWENIEMEESILALVSGMCFNLVKIVGDSDKTKKMPQRGSLPVSSETRIPIWGNSVQVPELVTVTQRKSTGKWRKCYLEAVFWPDGHWKKVWWEFGIDVCTKGLLSFI